MLWLRVVPGTRAVRIAARPRRYLTCQAASSCAPTIWPGLQTYRKLPVDKGRIWGEHGPQQEDVVQSARRDDGDDADPSCLPMSLAQWGAKVLSTADPVDKAVMTHRAWSLWNQGRLQLGSASAPDRPARPAEPPLVAPKLVPNQRDSGLSPAAYMLHNLAHIELNAIDLAWDTVVRFSTLQLDAQFYSDFAHVADDESRHLLWCLQRLQELGARYGDMPAHDLLWQGAQASAGDVVSRMAVVPMGQEARGLDAGSRLAERLVGLGDSRSARIVARIAEEERAHVAVGVAWFRHLVEMEYACEQDGASLDDQALATRFREEVNACCPELFKGPFHHEERQLVGLPQAWYASATVVPTPRRQTTEQQEKERAHRRRLQERLLAFVATEEEHSGVVSH